MKKKLLYWALLISITLGSQCLANQKDPTEIHSELTKAAMIDAHEVKEEKEVLLWQELTIYSLIIGIYIAYWMKQKA